MYNYKIYSAIVNFTRIINYYQKKIEFFFLQSTINLNLNIKLTENRSIM